MRLTLPANLPPKLLKLEAPVASVGHSAPTAFAALLESFHADTLGTPQETLNKKESAPRKETSRSEKIAPQPETALKLPAPKKAKNDSRTPHLEPNDSPQQKTEEQPAIVALTIVPPAPPSNQDVLPLVFTLNAQAAIQNLVEPDPLNLEISDPLPEQSITPPPSRPQSQLDSQSVALPRAPFTLSSINLLAPFAMPILHVQAKAKAPTAQTAEPLAVLQLPLQEARQKVSPSEIAFEAKLTPIQPKPDNSPFPVASTAPASNPAPREEAKPSNVPSTPETKPDRSIEAAASGSHAATPAHAIDGAVKAVTETPAFTTPSPHIEKPVTAERIPEPAKPALTSAADLPDIPAPRTEPARDISFRIASTPTDAVDVKLVDRAGQIHVAVRSSDPVLTQSLQSNVTELAGKLDKAGFQSETLIPNHPQPMQQTQQNNSFQQSLQDRRAPQQEFQPRKKRPAESNAVFSLNPQQEKS